MPTFIEYNSIVKVVWDAINSFSISRARAKTSSCTFYIAETTLTPDVLLYKESLLVAKSHGMETLGYNNSCIKVLGYYY